MTGRDAYVVAIARLETADRDAARDVREYVGELVAEIERLEAQIEATEPVRALVAHATIPERQVIHDLAKRQVAVQERAVAASEALARDAAERTEILRSALPWARPGLGVMGAGVVLYVLRALGVPVEEVTGLLR